MNRLLPFASLVLAASFAAAQQPAPQDNQPAPDASAPMHQHHAPNPQRETRHLAKKLSLTPDQSSKIEPIFANRDQQLASIQANTSLTPDQQHQQMRALHKDTMQQLAQILTPDQLAQFKAMRHGRHNGQQPPAGPQNGDQPAPQPQA